MDSKALSKSDPHTRFVCRHNSIKDSLRVLDFRAVIYHMDYEPRFHFGRYAESSPQPPLTKVLWPVM